LHKGSPVAAAQLLEPIPHPYASSLSQAICILMALAVTALSLQSLLSADAAALQSDFFVTTDVTHVLVRIAVAFFLWDTYVCLTEWAGWAYLAHALACLCVFTCALKPMLHYMAAITLLYEASTPFLHVRSAMIQAGTTDGPIFQALQLSFAASFFIARIVVGYWKCYQWWWQVEAYISAVSSGVATGMSVPVGVGSLSTVISTVPSVLRMYQALCLFLSALNGYWFLQIAQRAFSAAPAKSKAKKSA
jgi:hypothetical protein